MLDIQTPCFVLDYQMLENNINGFKKALCSRFNHNVLGYSVKTNSLPVMLNIMKEKGCYAEVVSYNEYNLAKSLKYQPSNIIYNGPLKSKETFIEALIGGAYVNIETKQEIDWLSELPSKGIYKVGIRINLKLNKISPKDCKQGEDFSRFGFSWENGELQEALDRITKCNNVVLAGFHLHRTSLTRSLNVYRNICKYASSIIQKYNLSLEYIDIGGGYYGDMPGKPSYQDYIDTIYNEFNNILDCSKLTLIVEPGNAIIASPFSYYSRIIDKKIIDDVMVLVSDGTRNDVDPLFNKKDYSKTFLSNLDDRKIVSRQVYVGSTCLENDRLFELENSRELDINDIVKFSFVGAYTMCLSPLFIHYFPRVYIYKNNSYKIVREEWTEKEYNQLSYHNEK